MSDDEDKTERADVVQLNPDRNRLQDAHAFIDQRIASGNCTGLLVLTVHESGEGGEGRGYCYQRFGATYQSDRVFSLERAKVYEMLDMLDSDEKLKAV